MKFAIKINDLCSKTQGLRSVVYFLSDDINKKVLLHSVRKI